MTNIKDNLLQKIVGYFLQQILLFFPPRAIFSTSVDSSNSNSCITSSMRSVPKDHQRIHFSHTSVKKPDPPLLSSPCSSVPLRPKKIKSNKSKKQLNTDHGLKSRNSKTSQDILCMSIQIIDDDNNKKCPSYDGHLFPP